MVETGVISYKTRTENIGLQRTLRLLYESPSRPNISIQQKKYNTLETQDSLK